MLNSRSRKGATRQLVMARQQSGDSQTGSTACLLLAQDDHE